MKCFYLLSYLFFCCVVLLSCVETVDDDDETSNVNFGMPSAFTNTSKEATCMSYDENNRFSKITFYNVTFTFEYNAANIIACNVVQKMEDKPDYGYALRKIEFIRENKNKVIAKSFMDNNVPIYSDTIYISDNGTPERINSTVFFTFESVTGNLIKLEDEVSTQKLIHEFEYDTNPGLFNNVNIDSWLSYYFYVRSSFVYPVFKLLLNHTNNVVEEKISFKYRPETQVMNYTYSYGENNYPQSVQMTNGYSLYNVTY